MGSIENQIAVVTGAGRGIGRAIAIELGDLGARLVLVARNRAELEDTSQRIGKNASVVPADVRKKDQLRRVFDSPVDILVNAAGLGIFGPVTDFKDEDFETLIETNLRGIFFACRFVLPSMIERKRGDIINIASIAGKVASANRSVYSESNFCVACFTVTLTEEIRYHGMRAYLIM